MNVLDMAMAYQCAMDYATEQAESDDDPLGAWVRRARRCMVLRDALLALPETPEIGPPVTTTSV